MPLADHAAPRRAGGVRGAGSRVGPTAAPRPPVRPRPARAGGPPRQPRLVGGQHPCHRRLLQHDLADQHRPGAGVGPAPGKVTRVQPVPAQDHLSLAAGRARWVSVLVMTNGSSHSRHVLAGGLTHRRVRRLSPPSRLPPPVPRSAPHDVGAPSIAGVIRTGAYEPCRARHDGSPEAHASGLRDPAGHARHPPHLPARPTSPIATTEPGTLRSAEALDMASAIARSTEGLGQPDPADGGGVTRPACPSMTPRGAGARPSPSRPGAESGRR